MAPAATSSAARAIASATSAGIVPISALTAAAALLISASAVISAGSTVSARDREVLDRPLGLCAPSRRCRDTNLAHRVVLDAVPEVVVGVFGGSVRGHAVNVAVRTTAVTM